MTRLQTVALIVQTLRSFRATGETEAHERMAIYGDGLMDSMALVVFIAELEARIGEATGRDLVLASERAMSRTGSPYRDVGSLTDFVQELLAEAPKS